MTPAEYPTTRVVRLLLSCLGCITADWGARNVTETRSAHWETHESPEATLATTIWHG